MIKSNTSSPKRKEKSHKRDNIVMRPRNQYAQIHIIGRHEPFTARIVEEGSHGFLCQMGGHLSPATEWFPYKTATCTAKKINR